MKPIRLSDHASRYMTKRGFTVLEVEEAIRTVTWQPAELERLECRKNFAYGKEWNGRVYTTTGSTNLCRGSFRVASRVYGALAPLMDLLWQGY